MNVRNSSLAQLIPREAREARAAEKRLLILRFLREEIYTAPSVLIEILNVQSRQSVHKTLRQMERQGLLRQEVVTLQDGSKQLLCGITSHGQGWAYDPQKGEHSSNRVFEPSRVGISVLRHTLDLQRLRIRAERGGWMNWIAGDRVRWQREKKRPDALAVAPSGKTVAIEVERSFKSAKRYEVILSGYLQMIRQGEINGVVWVSPTHEFTARLARMIRGIEEIPVAGQRVKIEPSRHHGNLFFTTYADWPRYELE